MTPTTNVFRKKYRELSEDEKQLVESVKDAAQALYELFEKTAPSREVSLAKTHLEESVMWAVKSITS